MDLQAFITSLATSFLLFLVLVFLFTWFSRMPSNSVLYYPNQILNGQGPRSPADWKVQRGPLQWIRDAWRASEDEVIALAGLDAAIYMIFLSSMLSILVYTAVYALPVLVALSATEPKSPRVLTLNSSSDTNATFDNLAMGNVETKSRIWAFVIGAYWLSICTYGVLWRSYRHVADLRAHDQALPKAKVEQFVVLVRDIPRPKGNVGSYAEQVDMFFKKLHPETYVQSSIVVDTRKVEKIWKEIEKCRRKLDRAEVEMANDGKRRQHRTGWLGVFGHKEDTIDFYNKKIKELLPKWELERKTALKERQQRAAFVFFNSRQAACLASQTLHSRHWSVEPAPEPRAVVWGNLAIRSLPDRAVRRILVYTMVFLIIWFYIIPISFISALISLDKLEAKLPFLSPIVHMSAIRTVLQAYLPQLALILFLAVLPSILLYLSKQEGLASLAEIQRAAAGKFFYFSVFNVFLGVTLASTAFSVLGEIIDHPTAIIDLLTEYLPPQSSFFITFISLRFLVGYGLGLTRLVPLVLYRFKSSTCKTEEELRRAWKPGPIQYATVVPGDMVVATIALSYAIIAPMILPFTIAYFAFAWLVSRNQMLNVYVAAFESYGRMWPHIHTRILAALLVSQLTMFGYFGFKAGSSFAVTVFMFPLPLVTLAFGYMCKKLYYPFFEAIPLWAVCEEVKETPSIHTLVDAYTPRCLLGDERFEDMHDKFDDARSNGSSRVPSGLRSPA